MDTCSGCPATGNDVYRLRPTCRPGRVAKRAASAASNGSTPGQGAHTATTGTGSWAPSVAAELLLLGSAAASPATS